MHLSSVLVLRLRGPMGLEKTQTKSGTVGCCWREDPVSTSGSELSAVAEIRGGLRDVM